MHFSVYEGFEILDRVFDLRREQIVRHRPHLIAPVNDHVRVFDNDLIGLLLTEIGKLCQHLIGRLEIQRQRAVGVGHLLGRKQDVAVDLVLGVEEVYIARGDDGLSELLAQLHDGAVEAAQLILTFGKTLFQHEGVVAQRLDLEEVVERGNALELRVALVRHDRLKQLARLTGRADEQTLPPAEHFRLRHDGIALEIFEVAVGNETVEVAQTDGVFRKDKDVPRTAIHDLAAAAKRHHRGIDGLKGVDVLLLQHGVKPRQHVAAGDGVIRCAVVIEVRQTQRVRHDVELVFSKVGHQILRQNERIDRRRLERKTEPLARRSHKADVKVGVVGAERPPVHKFQELRQDLLDRRRAGEHFVRDAGQIDDLRREPPAGGNKGLEGVQHLAALHHDRADLDDDVVLGGKPGRLQIERHILSVEIGLAVAVNHNAVVHVVDVVALAAVEDLDVLVRTRDLGLGGGLHCIGERLRAAVVGDGDGAVTPRRRLLDGGSRLGQRVHGGHGRMQMQLHALVLRGVLALGRLELLDGIRLHDHLVVIAVEGHLALNAHPHARLHVLFQNGLCLVRLHELVDADGAGVVGHIEADHIRVALFELAVLDGKDLALDHDTEHVEIQIADGDFFPVEGLAVEQIAARLGRSRAHGAGGLCRRLRGLLRQRGRVFDRLAADARGLLEQRLAL